MNPLEQRVQQLEKELAELKSVVRVEAGRVNLMKPLIVYGHIGVGGPEQGAMIFSGEGSPDDTVVAGIGSIFLRSNGTFDNTLYVKSGSDGDDGDWEKVPTVP